MSGTGDDAAHALVLSGWREAGGVMRLSMERMTPAGPGARRYADVTGLDANEAGLAVFGREVLETLFMN